MLTQLATVKSRLCLLPEDVQYDDLLTNTIRSVSLRFDHETHRTLARTENFTQEFDPADTEILAGCYPIECVTKFEIKNSEAAGWQEVEPTPDCLIRNCCIISLPGPLKLLSASGSARVTYTGGYVLPGVTPGLGQVPLPADLEQACVEQVAFWFQTRDKLGIIRQWPKGGAYEQFAGLDLLPSVSAILASYSRWTM